MVHTSEQNKHAGDDKQYHSSSLVTGSGDARRYPAVQVPGPRDCAVTVKYEFGAKIRGATEVIVDRVQLGVGDEILARGRVDDDCVALPVQGRGHNHRFQSGVTREIQRELGFDCRHDMLENGATCRHRTRDLIFTKDRLYRLS